MDFSLYTKEDLRVQLRHIREQQIRMDETGARWCERGLDTEDATYKMLRASADEIAGLGDELYAEICRRNAAEDTACRTCGFTGCPGAAGADCPRWPARV